MFRLLLCHLQALSDRDLYLREPEDDLTRVETYSPRFMYIYPINTFAASYLNTQGLNNSCLKSPASTFVDLTFQSRALRSFSLNQLCSLSL